MSTSCQTKCRPDCSVIAIVTSLILGIIAAFLRITGEITLTPAFLWVVLGIGIVYLAVALIVGAISPTETCNNLCSIVTTSIAGILGSILFSIILLAIEFVATGVIGAIFTGLLIFFFFLMLTSTACLIRCLYNCRD